MLSDQLDNARLPSPKRANLLIPILLLWGLVLFLGLGFLWFESDLGVYFQRFYLLPSAILTGMVVLAPAAYLLYTGKFDPFHPLVFAAWSYIFPAFVIGGFIISFGWVDPYFMPFIDNPAYTLPLSLGYVGIGFLGMTLGYFLPVGKFIANKLEGRLPKWQWEPSQVWTGGILLLVAGIGINILGFLEGIMGYQKLAEVGIFDALLFYLLVLLSEGNTLLWLAIFSVKERRGIFYLVLLLVILFLPFRMALQGSRSGLALGILPIAFAFRYSGRRLRWQYGVLFGVVLVLSVCIGVIYGTSFRNIKGSEARVDASDYIGQVGATIDYLSKENPIDVIQSSAQTLADRVENLSSLAVVVANYERLAPYEASYGLENNILNDTLVALVPRFVWNEKPSAADARAYSDLYFNFSENSFAITPFGDLLRNFGPFGVPIGMFVLGVYLRFIYAALIETPNPAMWKKVAYFPLLTLVSFEGFYSMIFPSLVRTVVVLIASLYLVNLIIKIRGRSRQSSQ
jgi:hypothetical protein